MSKIRLKAPEGYFEDSYRRTMENVSRIRNRRKAVASGCVAALLSVGIMLSIRSVNADRYEKEYLAQQAEMARLDIFLEINK